MGDATYINPRVMMAESTARLESSQSKGREVVCANAILIASAAANWVASNCRITRARNTKGPFSWRKILGKFL
jgi:hypothetical protein